MVDIRSDNKSIIASDDFQRVVEKAVKNRRYLHSHPQIAYKETRANELVRSSLDDLGLDYRLMSETGVVVDIVGRGGNSDRIIAIRADMDALPITEQTGLPYASQNPGFMHACGHDGHTAMLLGAVEILAKDRDFKGTFRAIFQPAEEMGAGAENMLKSGCFDGMQDHHPVFAFHNWPSLKLGSMATTSGPIMAAADYFEVAVQGKDGHVGMPDNVLNPVSVAAGLVGNFDGLRDRVNSSGRIVSLETTKFVADAGVLSAVTKEVVFGGSVRSFDPDIRLEIENEIIRLCDARSRDGFKVDLEYRVGTGATINDPKASQFAVESAKGVFQSVNGDADPAYTAEDFSSMLERRPGAYIWLGQGTGDPESPHDQVLHADTYNFNDSLIPLGVSYSVALVKNALPIEGKSLYPGL